MDAIIKQAQSWIGCKESDGSHKKIIDVYNTIRPLPRGYALKYTDAWCAGFVSAVAKACNATDVIPCECSCGYMIQGFQKMGRWIESDNITPDPGMILFYDWDDNGVGDCTGWPEHVGIVEKVENGYITIIEGNCSDSVARVRLKVNARYIRGYGNPKYSNATAKPAAKPVETVNKSLNVGDKVKLLTNAVYYDGKSIPSWVKKTTLYVREVRGDRVVISTLKEGAITGAVNIKYLKAL